MQRKIVDLHCHSTYSDGAFSPTEIAKKMSDGGVECASLTDHDSVEGISEFRDALQKWGIDHITGVEITLHNPETEFHLLAYNFDENNRELLNLLKEKRKKHTAGYAGNGGFFLTLFSFLFKKRGVPPISEVKEEFEEIVKVVKKAGGEVFLAHPFTLATNPEKLMRIISELKESGLSGIESFYRPYSEERREVLNSIAKSLGLHSSCGSDFHGYRHPMKSDSPFIFGERKKILDTPGIETTEDCWQRVAEPKSAKLI
ncbi:PHP domain-containing protein [bacterium]|nr:PHP domain-containing protein [bacterium]